MFNKLFRVFLAVLVVCLLLAVIPAVSLAEKQPEKNAQVCWGSQRVYYVSGNAGYYYIPVNCDNGFSIIDSYTKFQERSGWTSPRYNNKWITDMYPYNNKYLKIKCEENPYGGTRKCTLCLRCNTHGNFKIIDIIQNKKSGYQKPVIHSYGCTQGVNVKRGQYIRLTVKTSYAQRLFINTSSLGVNNVFDWVPYSGQWRNKIWEKTIYVPQSARTGTHYLKVEVSNSFKENDAWAMRTYANIRLVVGN